jgi:hypothetical protein
MRHEKTDSVSKIRDLWEPWEEDETPRKRILMFTVLDTNLWYEEVSLSE